MEINRRDLLLGSATLVACPVTSTAGHQQNELFASARREIDGTYAAAIFDPFRGDIANVRLPARGHDVAPRPGARECVAFARRPGNFAVAFGADRKLEPVWFAAAPDRHFFGHGVFSRDGRLLFSTENDFNNDRGVIGVRDATNDYRQIGEFNSGGVGPHDIAILGDGRTLVVANGGIRTHPDFGRRALNVAEMSPSLAYIDSCSGDVEEVYSLPKELHQLSIRHLSVAAHDTVVFGCQHKGPKGEWPKLVGSQRRGSALVLIDAPQPIYRSMRNYIASVAVDDAGELVAASSPRGNAVIFFDVGQQRYLGRRSMADVSGLASRPGHHGFLFSSGYGELQLVTEPTRSPSVNASKYSGKVAWENHAVSLGERA